jgi:ABC-type Na+ efflux pump permease subunit
MSMIVTKKSLRRRTFLRGMGTAVALPLLDAMVPALTALAQSPARPRTRFGAVFVPNGAIMSSGRRPAPRPASPCRRFSSPSSPSGSRSSSSRT